MQKKQNPAHFGRILVGCCAIGLVLISLGQQRAPSLRSPWTDVDNATRMRGWLRALREGNWDAKFHEQAAPWRMLVLVYPNTETDYKGKNGEPSHFDGSADPALIETVRKQVQELPALVRIYSRGYCKLTVDVKLVDRPLSINENGKGPCRLTHQEPLGKDYEPEVKLYNTPQQYDSLIVLYHPGPVPQDLAGAGGGGVRGTRASINFGDLGRWTKSSKSSWSSIMSWGQGCVLHEWIHGLDGCFSQRGYAIQPLHHTYKYGPAGLDSNEFYAAIFQGLLVDENGFRSGYSKSVWMSGTPLKPAALMPVQLLEPQPNSKFPVSGGLFTWAYSHAPDGYEIRFSPKEGGEVKAFSTFENRFSLKSGMLAPGVYDWCVVSKKGADRSSIFDTHTIEISETLSTGDAKVTHFACTPKIRQDGGIVYVRAEVLAESGVRTVSANAKLPNGTAISTLMRLRSGFPGETLYIGELWIPGTNSAREQVSLSIQAKTFAGGQTVSEAKSVGYEPKPLAATEEDISRFRAEVLDVAADGEHEGFLLAQVRILGKLQSEPVTNAWLELEVDDGTKTYGALVLKGWDDGDWRTDSKPVFLARLGAPSSSCFMGKLRVCYRPSEGIAWKSAWSPVVLPPTNVNAIRFAAAALHAKKAVSGGFSDLRLVETARYFRSPQLFWDPAEGDIMELKVEVPEQGGFNLSFDTASFPDNGSFEVSCNGIACTKTLECNSSRKAPSLTTTLGIVQLKAGTNTLSIRCLRTPPNSPGRRLGINEVCLIPISKP